MKSRAPSGVLLIRFGVSTSTKPFAWWTSRIAWTSRLRRSRRRCIGLAPDVEVAVAEPQRLVDRGLGVVDVERRRLRLVEDLEPARLELDLAGRQLRVLGPGQPQRDLALDGDDELGRGPGSRPRAPRGRPAGVDHDLGDAVPVAEVEEDQLPVVAPAVDPARRGWPPTRRREARRSPQVWVRYGRGEARGRCRSWPAYRSGRSPLNVGAVTVLLSDRRVHTTLPTSDVDGLRPFYEDGPGLPADAVRPGRRDL